MYRKAYLVMSLRALGNARVPTLSTRSAKPRAKKIRGSDWSKRGLCEVRGLDCCERKNDPERICEEKEEEKKLMMWSRRPGTFCA